MALHLELDPGDIVIVPTGSGAQFRVAEKSGRKTRLSVESAQPVQVLRARDENPAAAPALKRPTPSIPAGITKPRT